MPPQNITVALTKFATIRFWTKYSHKRHLDDYTFKQIWEFRKRKILIKNQQLDLAAHQELGSDLAVSRFVIGYCNGRIKDQNGNWRTSIKDLPKSFDDSFKVRAIDVRHSKLLSEGVDNFTGLEHLEKLDLSCNVNIDEFACDQLARQYRQSKTLREINLSHNPLVSVYGLDVLFRIPSIRKIVAINTRASKYEDIDLFTLAAEDERQCEVFVHAEDRKFQLAELEDLRVSSNTIESK